jgi:hypothetical protein
MPDPRLNIVDGVLYVDLSEGIHAPEFEGLYDNILEEVSAETVVLVDVAGAKMSGTGDFLLDSLVTQLRARDVSVTVLRRP